MQEALQDDLSLFALPLFLAAIALEAWWSRHRQLGWYRGRDTFVSLCMLLASGLVELLPRLLALWLMFQLHEISPLRDVVGRQWWAWLLLFFLEDFTYYWFHRSNHEVRLFCGSPEQEHNASQQAVQVKVYVLELEAALLVARVVQHRIHQCQQ